MIRSLFTAATGMEAQQLMVDTISNNIANVNTTGYKRGRANFQDLLYQTLREPGAPSSSTGTQVPSGIQVGLGVKPVAVEKLFTQGDFINTGNNLDLVIQGDGFFQVTQPDGTIAYTRDGSFQLDKDGRIVTADGYPLEPSVSIPSDAVQISVSVDGNINVLQAGQTAPVQVGAITLARFINNAGLQAVGNNSFHQTDASGDPITGAPASEGRGSINQGFLENSNVNVVQELANLITAQRAFDLNSKAVQASDQMLQTTTSLKQ